MTRRLVLFSLVFALFSCLLPKAGAQQVTASPAPPPAAIVPADNPKAFDPAAATQAWLNTVPADKRAESDAYFEGGYWLILWDYLIGAAIAIWLLNSRLSAGIRSGLEKLTRFKTLQAGLFAVVFVFITYVVTFPWTVYEQYFREHQYGLATQTFGPWFAEQIIALLVNAGSGAVALMILYAVFRAAPRTWWMWGTGVAIFFLTLAAMVVPVFIAPLFNTYKPLTDPAIRDPILALARANEIPVDQVYQFDASRQTTRVSANVSGFLGTTRISLNDNLLKQCSLPEVRHVMSHEMGHFVLNHILKQIFEFAVYAFVGFLLTRSAFDWAVAKWGRRWDVRGIADPAGFPLLILIFTTFSFLTTPLTNTMTRMQEREADAFGLNAAREPDGFAQSALKLGSYRKLNPGPIEEIVFYDHPSGRARIRMAMDWKGAQLPCGGVK
jgi:Zn-dependent protease with chaperone function